MTIGKLCITGVVALFAASFASGAGLTFTCDQTAAGDPDNYAAGTCNYLNNTIAALYTSTFNNIDAKIYIQQGITGLGGSSTALDAVSFSDYLGVVTGTASGDAVDTGALSALHSLDKAVYRFDNVVMPSALAAALGFTGVTGITTSGVVCPIADADCYNGVITVTTPANLTSENSSQSLYWRQNGGNPSANAYDYYGIVEHETDEVLGTISCIDTQSGGVLTDQCDSGGRTGTPSPNDLFRYNSAGSLAVNNAYIGLGQAPTGAYFSWNGGVTNGAAGATFNTIANGADYADFANSCAFVQDAVGCTGQRFDISTDGGAEINMLDAVGYNLAAPEPGTMVLFGAALAGFGLIRRHRRG